MSEVIVVPDVPHEHSGHPAKLHQSLASVLVGDYSRQGGSVLDPFAGIGTVPRVARAMGRRAVGVEIERDFVVRAAELGVDLVCGDSRALVPTLGLFDLILTSPPYGEAIGRSGDRAPEKTARAKADYEIRRFGRQISKHSTYGTTAGNMGALPLRREQEPCFLSEFQAFAHTLSAALTPGGRLVLIVKDQRLGRREQGACDLFAVVREAGEAAGLIYEGRRVAILPDRMITQWQRVNAARWGIPIPNAEHVCVLRRPGTASAGSRVRPPVSP